jgi:regulator of sirC expression with transglutaminase-like and TPR domain
VLTQRLTDTETNDDQAEVISDLLGGQMYLRGNEDDYYNVENSLLPNVIESRLGIPLSVTLVYMLVAKRAGLRVEGVGLPGHFIARIGSAFFDPFHGGRRMHLDECRKLLRSQGSELQPHHLLPCSPRAILGRMLNNLLHIAVQKADTVQAQLVQSWLQALQKGDADSDSE